MPCPEPEVLAAFSRGRLAPGEQRDIEAHLDGCESCGRVVADLARIYATDRAEPAEAQRDSGALGPDATLADESLPPPTRPLLVPGARLDRYHILEVVGRGGMGIVYAAYDPDLDRKVALKVLHERDEPGDEQAQRRLLREAQAMARLSHPNVITVHEARVADGRVFLSMEFVDGGTLSQWLATQAPALPRVLEMFRGVGRGLAAAHAAGLVHRDVKPDNVLIGSDARPRVTDFGLARPSEGAAEGSLELVASGARAGSSVDGLRDGEGRPLSSEPRLLDATLTRAGALVGTPAYMAPEQLQREPATAASDQFGFCVALYEALYGGRPFTGRNLFELATNVVAGTMVEPERDSKVPRWLRQVVLRGLAVRPEDRWPSMAALVERLELPRRRRRGLWAAGTMAVALVVAGSLANQAFTAPADPCAGGAKAIEELWTSGARDEVQRALAEGSTAYAEETAALAVQRLDDYAAQWVASHRDACEDYHRGGQSSEAFDLRGGCLDERLRELRALVSVLGRADPEVRRHAVEAVDGLPSLGLCEDVPALRVRAPLPEDPALRAQVDELEDARVRMQALGRSGRYAEALGRANEIIEAVRAVGHAPLLARTLHDRAELHEQLRRSEDAATDLREAWALALETADDALAAEISVRHVSVLGYSLKRFEAAEVRVEEAQAMIERVRRNDPRHAEALAADLDGARGQIELRQHRYATAAERFERALRVIEQQVGPDGLRVAEALTWLASARLPVKQWDEAYALFERVLAIRIKHLGPAHPSTAQARNNLALALKNMGRLDEAAAQLEQARALTIAALGPEHPAVHMAEMNLAEAYHLAGRHREAVDVYTLAFGSRGLVSIDDEFVLRRVSHFGLSLAETGRLAQARDVLARAHARAQVIDTPHTVRVLEVQLAHLELQRGYPERALALLDRLEPPASEPDAIAGDILLTRARALASRGQREEARALLPAIRTAAHAQLHPDDLGRLLATLDE